MRYLKIGCLWLPLSAALALLALKVAGATPWSWATVLTVIGVPAAVWISFGLGFLGGVIFWMTYLELKAKQERGKENVN
jgi:hypothetical protein